ncbi:PHP domain-containing protein [Thermodesulfobacteriota bacterium]
MRIDLHIHSTASDGTFSPLEIIQMARELKLGAIAITDHDTIAGAKEALSVEIPPSLRFLTGVEISTSPPPSYYGSGSFHILGYCLDLSDPTLNKTLIILQNARENRNPHIIERLNSMGVDISLEEVRCEADDCQLGRPHIAQTMVRKRIVASINEAFDNYLAKGKPAYVDKYRIACNRAIQILLDAGGIPVLAHPVLLNIKKAEGLEELILDLKSMGLKGIEVYYPEQTPADTARYIDLAKRHGLLMTGGTDFHGAIKPDVKMGSGKGDLYVPYELYEELNQETAN